MISQPIKDELWKWIRSFAGAVAAGAVLTAMNWIGAHVPDIISFVLTMGGGYVTQHAASANATLGS